MRRSRQQVRRSGQPRDQARTALKAIGRSEAVSVVRVSLKGKSADQIQTEIRSAAEQVCKANRVSRDDFNQCVSVTIRSAKALMQAMNTGQASGLLEGGGFSAW